MSEMRAKMRVASVVSQGEGDNKSEQLTFVGVAKSDGYGDDGLDENNTFAKFSPQVDCSITVCNPVLLGKFEQDEEYYVDFTKAG